MCLVRRQDRSQTASNTTTHCSPRSDGRKLKEPAEKLLERAKQLVERAEKLVEMAEKLVQPAEKKLGKPVEKQSEPAEKKLGEPAENDWQWSETGGEGIHCWKLPQEVSQCHLEGRQQISNACTFIALMLARYHYHSAYRHSPADDLLSPGPHLLTKATIELLGHAILEGNEWYDLAMAIRRARGSRKELYSILEAMDLMGHIYEIDYARIYGVRLNLARYIQMACKHSLMDLFSQVFIVVVVIESAILVTYDRDASVIALYDGHDHESCGATVMAAPFIQLNAFVDKAIDVLFPDLTGNNDRFEMSVIQMVKDKPPAGVLARELMRRKAPSREVLADIFSEDRNIDTNSE